MTSIIGSFTHSVQRLFNIIIHGTTVSEVEHVDLVNFDYFVLPYGLMIRQNNGHFTYFQAEI